jgi:hypothetical protein
VDPFNLEEDSITSFSDMRFSDAFLEAYSFFTPKRKILLIV